MSIKDIAFGVSNVDNKEEDDLIAQNAAILGLDATLDAKLMWIARQFSLSKLPDDFEVHSTDSGAVYYYNNQHETSQWEHPLLDHYKNIVARHRNMEQEPSVASSKSSKKPSVKSVKSVKSEKKIAEAAQEMFAEEVERPAIASVKLSTPQTSARRSVLQVKEDDDDSFSSVTLSERRRPTDNGRSQQVLTETVYELCMGFDDIIGVISTTYPTCATDIDELRSILSGIKESKQVNSKLCHQLRKSMMRVSDKLSIEHEASRGLSCVLTNLDLLMRACFYYNNTSDVSYVQESNPDHVDFTMLSAIIDSIDCLVNTFRPCLISSSLEGFIPTVSTLESIDESSEVESDGSSIDMAIMSPSQLTSIDIHTSSSSPVPQLNKLNLENLSARKSKNVVSAVDVVVEDNDPKKNAGVDVGALMLEIETMEKEIEEETHVREGYKESLSKAESDLMSERQRRRDLESDYTALQQRSIILAERLAITDAKGEENRHMEAQLSSHIHSLEESINRQANKLSAIMEQGQAGMKMHQASESNRKNWEDKCEKLIQDKSEIVVRATEPKPEPRPMNADKDNKMDEELRANLSDAKSRLSSSEREVKTVSGELTTTRQQLTDVTMELKACQSRLSNIETDKMMLTSKQRDLEMEIADLKTVIREKDLIAEHGRDSEISLNSVKSELRQTLSNLTSLEEEKVLMTRRIRELESDSRSFKREADQKSIELERSEKQRLEETVSLRKDVLAMKEKMLLMNDRIAELQGNIRVICRIRPMQPDEAFDHGESIGHISFPDDNKLDFNDVSFEYDRVLGFTSSQVDVFEQVSNAVTSVLNGYRVCIFAYGQTGSGKTHTMIGPPQDAGVNIRSLQLLFDESAATRHLYETKISVGIVEVYNERIRDLLAVTPASSSKHNSSDNNDTSGDLDIRLGKSGVYVEGALECEVYSLDEAKELMQIAANNRVEESNNVNEHSSRSHLVMTVSIMKTVKGSSDDRSQAKQSSSSSSSPGIRGKLFLVDLAGSERLKVTAAAGQRLKEAQNINKSLSALGDVIHAMANNAPHIPFRNSKLTFLLQEAFASHSRVLMVVNVSPSLSSVQESVCSLNFALRCRSVQLGQVRKMLPLDHKK